MNYRLSIRRARPGAWTARIHNRWGVTVWQALYDSHHDALQLGGLVLRMFAALPRRAAA